MDVVVTAMLGSELRRREISAILPLLKYHAKHSANSVICYALVI